jgi:uncharacterized protein (UPF0333 family)
MAKTDTNVINRGATAVPALEFGIMEKAAGTINPRRCAVYDSSGNVTQGTASSEAFAGVYMGEGAAVSGDQISINVGPVVVVADDAIGAGKPIKIGDSGRVLQFVDSTLAATTIKTTGAGVAFTNQPANDGIEVVSASAADTTQTVTIIGTTTGTDTVVAETVTLNGTTPVATTKTDWGVVLALKKSAATAGTVTVREASADQTISAGLTAAVLSLGVEAVTAADQQAYNVAPTAVASGATTKQIAVGGTNSAGTQIYASKALNGTTAVTFATAFKRVTEVYTGDVEASRTVVVKVGAAGSESVRIGKSRSAATAQGDVIAAFVWP